MNSWVQIVVLILIFVVPALKQIHDKVKERAEVDRRKRDQERARTASLRTGATAERSPQGQQPQQRQTVRAAPPIEQRAGSPSDRSRLQQLEAERERRLRELRRVAQQRTQGGRAGAAPTAQRPQAQRPRAQQQATRRQQQQANQPVRQRPAGQTQTRRIAQPQKPAARPVQRPQLVQSEEPSAYDITTSSTTTGLRAVAGSSHVGATAGNAALGAITRQNLRRAVVLNELLGQPVALRKNHLQDQDAQS